MATETMSVTEETQDYFNQLADNDDFKRWTKCVLLFKKTRKTMVKVIGGKFKGYIQSLPKDQRIHLKQFVDCCKINNVKNIKTKENENKKKSKKEASKKKSKKEASKEKSDKDKHIWECSHTRCAVIFSELVKMYIPSQQNQWDIRTKPSTTMTKQNQNQDVSTGIYTTNDANKTTTTITTDKLKVETASPIDVDDSEKVKQEVDKGDSLDSGKSMETSKNTDQEPRKVEHEPAQLVENSSTTETTANVEANQDTPGSNDVSVELSDEDIEENEEAQLTCLEYYWDIAKLFIYGDPGNKDVDINSPEGLDISLVIKLMRSCNLFDFNGSAQIYDDIIKDRNSMMHSRESTLNTDNMKNVFQHIRSLLEGIGSPECQKLLGEMPQFEDECYVTGTRSQSFMYLAERALRMQTAALKYDVAVKKDKGRETELEELLNKTSRRLENANKWASTSTVQELEHKNRQYKLSNHKLERENTHLKFRIDQLLKQTSSQQNLRSVVRDRDNTIRQMQQELFALRAKVFQASEKEAMQRELDSLRCSIKRLQSETQSLEQTISELNTENDKLKKELLRMPEKIKELESEVNLLKMTISSSNDKIKELERKSDQLLDEKNAVTEENVRLKRDIRELKEKIENLSDSQTKEIRRLENEVTKWIEVVELYEDFARKRITANHFKTRLRELNRYLENPRPIVVVENVIRQVEYLCAIL